MNKHWIAQWGLVALISLYVVNYLFAGQQYPTFELLKRGIPHY